MDEFKRLPFATYDIAVYLLGGAVTLVLSLSALHVWVPNSSTLIPLYFDGDTVGVVVKGVFWLGASYLTGHIVAFISTYVVERFVHNTLGYPSQIWLELERAKGAKDADQGAMRPIWKKRLHEVQFNIVFVMTLICQLPMFPLLLIFYWIRPFGFYTPKIPVGLLAAVRDKFASLEIDLSIKDGSRWEKVVEHHVANKCPSAYSRMYNYLIIYGVLRMMCVIILGVAWLWLGTNVYNAVTFGLHFSFIGLLQYVVIFYAYGFSLMAFAKFNRRYFEESILGFLFADGIVTAARGGPRIRTP
ncbi:MAG: hypothetical protein ACKOQM_01720 [Novosphingobium sp.]